jgi:hypothetical protein
MRRHFQLSMLCLAVGLASACKDPETFIKTESIPTVGFRFINAVPDTNAMDLRFIDIVENSAHYQIGFRDGPATSGGVTGSAQIEYKNTRAGDRHFRIFLNGNTAAVASTVLRDTTVTLVAGKVYTAIMQGSARSGGMNLVVYEELIADPAASVALRVINTTPNPIDVRTYPATGTAPAAPTWASVSAYSRSAFVTAAPGQMKYNVVAAGGATALFPDALALIGAPATSSAGTSTLDLEGLPGTTQAGSAVTAIVFPPSVTALTGSAGAGTVTITSGGAATFSTSQAGKLDNGTQIAVGGVAYTVSSFNGTTTATLSGAPNQGPVAFTIGSNAVQFPATGISFMWDRRPPRPAGT